MSMAVNTIRLCRAVDRWARFHERVLVRGRSSAAAGPWAGGLKDIPVDAAIDIHGDERSNSFFPSNRSSFWLETTVPRMRAMIMTYERKPMG